MRTHRSSIKLRAAVALSALFVAASVSSGSAASVPMQALSKVPADTLALAYVEGGTPTNGLVGPNVNGWESVGFQRGATEPLDAGAIKGDADLVERWWPVLDASFAHQRPDGGFEYAPVIGGVEQKPANQFSGDSFWLGESEVALLLLRNSSLATSYSARIDALVPKYRLALQFLIANKDQLLRGDFDFRTGQGATNRLFADAEAYLLGDRLTGGVPGGREAGQEFLNRALAAQGPDGDFPEKGGHDTSYNATSCLRIAEILMFYDDPRLLPALQRAYSWEEAQISDEGRVDTAGNTRTNGQEIYMGHVKKVNYGEVTRMLVLVSALTGDTRALDTAHRTASYFKANRAALR